MAGEQGMCLTTFIASGEIKRLAIATGQPGLVGATGSKGVRGEAGLRGESGMMGPPGRPGK